MTRNIKTTDRLENNHIKMAPFNISLEFHRLLARIDCSNSLIGKLADGKLRMPKTSSDGRRRTWYKTIEVISRICNHPTSRDDCWLVPPNTPHGLYSIKLSPNGSKNKWCGPRVVFALANPKELTYIEERRFDKHVAHRCGNGPVANSSKPICLNPYHLVLVASATNQDHKGCKYGCAMLCPHEPKCIFVQKDTGHYRPCLNTQDTPLSPKLCSHIPRCL
jgi:hypothetical protein